MCIPSCEDFSYQFVSNPGTRSCECKIKSKKIKVWGYLDCGNSCTRCTLKDGCTDCHSNDSKVK